MAASARSCPRRPRSAGRVMESFTHPVNRINHLIPRHALGEVAAVQEGFRCGSKASRAV